MIREGNHIHQVESHLLHVEDEALYFGVYRKVNLRSESEFTEENIPTVRS